MGTRPADELVLLEHVNLLCEEKRTDGDRFKLSMLRADQLTGLINFEKALDRIKEKQKNILFGRVGS